MFNYCPNCGEKNGGWKFCPNCGTNLDREIDGANAQNRDALAIFEYEEHDDGTVTITDLRDTTISAIDIPDNVTAIAENAFLNCKNVKSVRVGKNVSSIGVYAFKGCSSLTSIRLTNTVSAIGTWAFEGCNALRSVTIASTDHDHSPEKDYASSSSAIAPGGGSSIGMAAFVECKSLKNVTIPNGITSIGQHAFFGCSALKSITIPNGVTFIGTNAFPPDCKIIRK